TQLTVRKEKIAQLENNLRKRGGSLETSLNADLSDFSASYEQALQHYYSHEFEAAIYLFNSLLETSPTHRLASNCQYWLGECYFGQGDYSQALDAFKRVMAYDQSFKRDDALLMMGRSYIKLDQRELAKQMFDKLMSEYPDSEYFQKAQQYAESIR
ncbi:MAG: tetratricopeptide repeat protein, partial [candidate division KSB1 bacterium]|nr:tetratricopeptide repeat protein [candidate division KSB1 bacterium]